jgi:hypothetical protein
MDMMVSKQSNIEQALARVPARSELRIQAQHDPNFDVQHLTAKDIAKIEEALNTVDLETMVTAVDQIVGRHLPKARR